MPALARAQLYKFQLAKRHVAQRALTSRIPRLQKARRRFLEKRAGGERQRSEAARREPQGRGDQRASPAGGEGKDLLLSQKVFFILLARTVTLRYNVLHEY